MSDNPMPEEIKAILEAIELLHRSLNIDTEDEN